MIPFILIGAALVAGAVAYTFWDEIKNALKKAASKVKTIVKGMILGFKTYIETKNISSSIDTFYKFYSEKSNGDYIETIVTKKITANDLPPEIKSKINKAKGKPIDISDELESVLEG